MGVLNGGVEFTSNPNVIRCVASAAALELTIPVPAQLPLVYPLASSEEIADTLEPETTRSPDPRSNLLLELIDKLLLPAAISSTVGVEAELSRAADAPLVSVSPPM